MFAGWSQETPARTADEFNFASLIDVLDTVFIDFHDSRIEGLSAAGVEIVGNTNNAVIVASDLRSARIRSVGQFAIEVANDQGAVQAGIIRQQPGRVLRHDEVAASRDRLVRRKRVADATDEPPAADVHRNSAAIEQLDILVVAFAG